MGSDIGFVGEVGRSHNWWFRDCLDDWGLRGADFFPILSQVAFGCCHRLEKFLTNKEGGPESRPGCKETSIDGLRPGSDNRAETGTVKIGDEIRLSFHGVDAVDEGQADGGRFGGTDAWWCR